MEKVKIKLEPLGKELEVRKGVNLIDVLHEYGVEFPCAGKGTCGKCKVKLLEGDIHVSDQHRKALNRLNLGDEWRLACYSCADMDVTFEIGQYQTIILADETNFKFIPQDGYGVAVDLGTTTIVAQLLNLNTGEILGVETIKNPQSKFGSDLISRIQKGLEGHANELTQIVRNIIDQLIQKLLEQSKVELKKVVIVGNTVMHHTFCGFDLQPLSMYPFESPKLGLQYLKSDKIGWKTAVKDDIVFYPSIGSFVGSDILAGIVSTKLYETEKYTMLVDLGTNGEIAVGNKDKILCASAAAGPAFEGANISQGMQATTGALSSIDKGNDGYDYHIIGNVEGKGICGSGLIDAISLLRKEGKLGSFGEITSGDDFLPLIDHVGLVQKDISEFLLAKSAMATGIHFLVQKLGLNNDDIDAIYIAGGFGNYIRLENVAYLGMLEFPSEKIHKMGNTALIGAKMLLFEEPDFVQPILDITEHINLESISEFQDVFVEKMMF